MPEHRRKFSKSFMEFVTDPEPPWWKAAAFFMLIGFALLGLAEGIARDYEYYRAEFIAYAGDSGITLDDGNPEHALCDVVVEWSTETVSWRPSIFAGMRYFLPGDGGTALFIPRAQQRVIEQLVAERLEASVEERHALTAAEMIRNGEGSKRYLTATGAAALLIAFVSILFIGLSPILGLIRTCSRRRCRNAVDRWEAGLCPNCKYPRSPETGVTCPECGRDMPAQHRTALARLRRKESSTRRQDMSRSGSRLRSLALLGALISLLLPACSSTPPRHPQAFSPAGHWRLLAIDGEPAAAANWPRDREFKTGVLQT